MKSRCSAILIMRTGENSQRRLGFAGLNGLSSGSSIAPNLTIKRGQRDAVKSGAGYRLAFAGHQYFATDEIEQNAEGEKWKHGERVRPRPIEERIVRRGPILNRVEACLLAEYS